MYVNFWTKKDGVCDLDSLFKYQESYMHNEQNPVSQIEFIDGAQRIDVKTAIRVARFKFYPGMAEYTGFVDFEHFIFLCVLFAPDELASKNLGKLRFVMRKVFPMTVRYAREGEKSRESIQPD